MLYRIENYDINPSSKIYQQLLRYYDYCKYECNCTKDTLMGKTSSLNHFARWSKIEDINNLTTNLALEYIAYQTKRNLMPRTINNRIKHLKAMVNYFRDYEDLEIGGFSERKVRKQHEEVPPKRAFRRKTICEALHYADREAWLMIKICFDCGLRIQELQGLRLQDINGDRVSILGKGRKRRQIKLSEAVIVRLKDFIKRENITDYVWKSKTKPSCPKSIDTIRSMMRKPFECASVTHFCPHELRYSYATDLKRLGASTRSIQQGLGHSSEKITEHYLKDLDDDTLNELYKLKYSTEDPELY